MAKQTITSGAGVLWSAIVTMLNNMFTELYGRFLSTGIVIPTAASDANFSIRAVNGGGTNDTMRIGYNLSDTLYQPTDPDEPQIYIGFEASWGDRAEIYWRYADIGNTGSGDDRATGFVEPFYCSIDRATSLINTVMFRGETITFSDTDQNSIAAFTKTAARITGKVAVGTVSAAENALDIAVGSYTSTFGGLAVKADAVDRVRIGCMDGTLAGSTAIPAQIIWGAGPGSSGGLQIGSRGDVLAGISLYTSPGATGLVERVRVTGGGNVGIGSTDPKSPLHVVGIPVFANNAAAITGGLTAGAFYRTGADPDPLMIVH